MPWDYTQQEYDKQIATDDRYRLERLINYGLNGQKLPRTLLEKYLLDLNIPEDRKAFLKLLLWNTF
ncbi:MAG: hypothetical protein KGZ58_03325 [Ignavibacteriales bacterium]|nr:hypothetical protein [Ignavibacteriales bacterium]